jgi:hypothetical protein
MKLTSWNLFWEQKAAKETKNRPIQFPFVVTQSFAVPLSGQIALCNLASIDPRIKL